MLLKKLAVAAITLALLAGCQDSGTKQTFGTIIGAGAGALAGSQIGSGRGQLAAVAVGTLAGALIGSEIGKSLDRADQAAMQRSTQRALETTPSGHVSEWRNPDSGHYGTVTPEPAYRSSDGEYCREYQQTVTIDGKTERAYGTACRQPDGSWKVVGS